MTEYMVRTSIAEADEIVSGNKAFIFRDSVFKYKCGDVIMFIAYRDKRPTRHKIEKLKFLVTFVDKSAPIETGWNVIGFRRI